MWFKRKRKKKVNDFHKYNIKLNVKTIVFFEKMSNKSFYDIETLEDMVMLMYSTLVVNNPDFNIPFNVFIILLEDENVMRWIMNKYAEIQDFNTQFITPNVDNEEKKEIEGERITITELVYQLIVQYGIDPHYVMWEMDFWEMEALFKQAEQKTKNDLIGERLWTYIKILPHIDGKKLKSPHDLLPFEWEEDEETTQKINKEKPKSLDEMQNSILATLEAMNHKKEEPDG